jgi:hypothetical protein
MVIQNNNEIKKYKKRIRCKRCSTLVMERVKISKSYYDYELGKHVKIMEQVCNKCKNKDEIKKLDYKLIRFSNKQILDNLSNIYGIKLRDDTLKGDKCDKLDLNILKKGIETIIEFDLENSFNNMKL